MKNYNLILYYFESCPYCQKVMAYFNKNKVEVTLKNINEDPVAREELLRVGGKTQVPCLFIDGEPLYESNDIIQWVENNK